MVSDRILPFMDSVVELDRGRLVSCGPPSGSQGEEAQLFEMEKAVPGATSRTHSSSGQIGTNEVTIHASPHGSTRPAKMKSQHFELQRQTGNWSVYRYYSQTAGSWVLIIWALFTISEAVFANISRE